MVRKYRTISKTDEIPPLPQHVIENTDIFFKPLISTHSFTHAHGLELTVSPFWCGTSSGAYNKEMPTSPTKITLLADIEGAHLHVGYGPTEPIKLLLAMEQTSAGTRAVSAHALPRQGGSSSNPDSSGDAFSASAIPPAPSPGRWHCVSRRAIPMPPDSYPWPVLVRPPGEARQNRRRGRQAVSRLRP